MFHKSLALATLASLLLTASSALATPPVPPTPPASFSIQHSEFSIQPSTLLADEIIRRLRRLGFNMIHNRLARPVEVVGDYA